MNDATHRLLIAMTLLSVVPSADAANFLCLSSADALESALALAAGNGEDDFIQLMAGNYVASGEIPFTYATQEDFALEIVGGYVSPPGVPGCILTEPASSTVISGENQRRALDFVSLAGAGDIRLRNLTISDGASAGQGAGLRVGGSLTYVGDILIDRVAFVSNASSTLGGGLSATTNGGSIRIQSSLFLVNQAGSDYGAAALTANGSATSRFVNNTIVFNGCGAGAPAGCDGGVGVGGSTRWVLGNSVFHGNEGVDWFAQSDFDLVQSRVPRLTGTPDNGGVSLDIADPGFVNVLGNYRLRDDSPLRDIGAPFSGERDLDGNPRYSGPTVDVGAYEYPALLRDGFENPLF